MLLLLSALAMHIILRTLHTVIQISFFLCNSILKSCHAVNWSMHLMVYDRSFLLTMCHVCFAAVSLLDVDNKHATLRWKFLFTWSLSADAYWLNVWFNVKPNVPKCVCVHESVLKCGRVIWVLCVWTCWLFCTCICVRLSAHMCLEKWVFVCGSLSLCLCVCMCFAHSKPIFIHPAISKVVHLLVGRFRQGQDERVEKLMFSGDSLCVLLKLHLSCWLCMSSSSGSVSASCSV